MLETPAKRNCPKWAISLIAAALFFISCGDHTSDLEEVDISAFSSGAMGGPSDNLDPSNSSNSKIVEYPKTMHRVATNDKKISIGEKINVTLNYDYYIGETEVTCGEYGDETCGNDSLPIVNVTYFDAVLFANKKSKAENLDTVYTYNSALFDSKNHCTLLGGFAFDNTKNGYRLPTEAEWIKAASKNWDSKKSWNSGNSENKPHPVCSQGKNKEGFCDFAGNVMEWVNDWFTPVTDTTLTNFIGGASANGLGERVLKGGSYVNDPQSINLKNRSDVYTVTSATYSDYVGFRLAAGKIPTPSTIGEKPATADESIVSLTNSEAIKAITGTYSTKLVFRNDVTGNLVYIDYSDVSSPIIEIKDTLNSYHPEISPNGEWVAFSTSIEGVSGKSSLYARKLDPTGSGLVKLEVESATIPRWSVKANGDTVIVYVNDAGNNKEEEEWKQKSTWEVPFSNGAFGIPQKLFDGSYHGGINENATLAISGARVLRARIAAENGTIYDANAKDTIWYNGEQACNASLVKDGTGRTAFLDFGGKTGREFVGQSYSTHQRLLIADSNGNLVQSISAWPNHTFDHTEWASNGKTSNIVATLVNSDGEHQFIALVSVKDSAVIPIVQGQEIWHPSIWLAQAAPEKPIDHKTPAEILDPDSAGVYFVANVPGSELAIKWRYKMELLWKYKDHIKTIILGSSRALHGVIPTELDDKFWAVNFANSNGTLYCAKYFFDNYALTHIKNLKTVVVTLDLDIGYYTTNNSFFLAYRHVYPGFIYDENHNFWKDGVPKELPQRTYESVGYSYYVFFRETLGYEAIEANGWGTPVVWKDSTWMDTESAYYNANFNVLTDMLAEAQQRNITVIGVIFPQNPAYKNTGSFGFHGIQRSQAPGLIQQVADLSKIYPNFILMDENNMGDHDYTDEMANDNDHLADKGAHHFTHKLNDLLNSLEHSELPPKLP